MSAKGDIYLGALGSEVLITAFGRSFTIKDTEISRQERTASGRLVKDIIAVKKNFTLAYDMIDGADLETLLTIYDLQSELSLLVYNEDLPETTTTGSPGAYADAYTVLMEPIDRTRMLLLDTGLWGGVSIELSEV